MDDDASIIELVSKLSERAVCLAECPATGGCSLSSCCFTCGAESLHQLAEETSLHIVIHCNPEFHKPLVWTSFFDKLFKICGSCCFLFRNYKDIKEKLSSEKALFAFEK